MDCNKAQELMHPYMDGELDPASALQFEQHHASCAACSAAYGRLRAVHEVLKAEAPVYQAPSHLRQRILAQLAENPASPSPVRKAPRWSWTWLNFGLATTCSAMLAVLLTLHFAIPNADDQLVQEIIAGHNRSLLANHLADVASSDRHTVKPWFTGKLDFAPPVYDLAREGFPLVGGRLDYLNHRSVAALAYRHRQHILNLFIWPNGAPNASSHDTAPRIESSRGFHLLHWNQSGMVFWLVSDMDAESEMRFQKLLRASIAAKSESSE